MCELCGKKQPDDWSRFNDKAKDYQKAQEAYKALVKEQEKKK